MYLIQSARIKLLYAIAIKSFNDAKRNYFFL